MTLFRHLTEVTMLAAFDDRQFGVGYLLGKGLGRGHMIACPPFAGILASDDDQRRRGDRIDELRGLVALSGDNVTQIALERRNLLDDEILELFHDFRALPDQLVREHESRPPVIVLVFFVPFFDQLNTALYGNTAGIVFNIVAVFS